MAFAVAFGATNVVDSPTRQTFISEIVGRDLLGNAVSLNSIIVNAARAIGPAVAGILIVTVDLGACFLIDAASYVAVLIALALMNARTLHRSEPEPRRPGQIREGLRYVRATPHLFAVLLMMTLVGTFAYEFQVSLPVFASQTFGGGADAYGFMTAAMGIGAVLGGLNAARRGTWSVDAVITAAALFGATILVTAIAPFLWVATLALLAVGATSITFLAGASTTLQLTSAPHMRGRVMALWAVAFLGSTPVGGPIVGWVAQHAGARWSLVLGAVAAFGAAALGRALLGKSLLGKSLLGRSLLGTTADEGMVPKS
jgi:MFS family permease